MTEAFEKWIDKAIKVFSDGPTSPTDFCFAEGILRAFVTEVERRAKSLPCKDTRCVPDDEGLCCHRISDAFDELTRELLGPPEGGE